MAPQECHKFSRPCSTVFARCTLMTSKLSMFEWKVTFPPVVSWFRIHSCFPCSHGTSSQSLLTNGEKSLDEQHPAHGKVHNSGLLFGFAADPCTEPDWSVLPDGRQPNAWKLLHAARKGGNQFCVGSGLHHAPWQADETANKAEEYQFESLHKICFYDAWRWKIELNQPESPLHLPPRPFFFHEYGRRVGMVPRSSLKEGKHSQMVEKRTKKWLSFHLPPRPGLCKMVVTGANHVSTRLMPPIRTTHAKCCPGGNQSH